MESENCEWIYLKCTRQGSLWMSGFQPDVEPWGNTHTLKTGNKPPGLTTPGQFLGYSLEPRRIFSVFHTFLRLYFRPEVSRPLWDFRSHKLIHTHRNLPVAGHYNKAFTQPLSRCYSKCITCCANLRRLRLGWKESCWTAPAGAGFFPQMFYVGGDGNSQFCSTASALSRKPKQQVRDCHKNMHRVP